MAGSDPKRPIRRTRALAQLRRSVRRRVHRTHERSGRRCSQRERKWMVAHCGRKLGVGCRRAASRLCLVQRGRRPGDSPPCRAAARQHPRSQRGRWSSAPCRCRCRCRRGRCCTQSRCRRLQGRCCPHLRRSIAGRRGACSLERHLAPVSLRGCSQGAPCRAPSRAPGRAPPNRSRRRSGQRQPTRRSGLSKSRRAGFMTGDCEHRDGGGKGYFLEEDYNIIRGEGG